MLREFFIAYLKRLLVLVPVVSLAIFPLPYPIMAKLSGMLGLLFVIFIVQLLYAIIVCSNISEQRARDVKESAEDPEWSAGNSRKARRRRARMMGGEEKCRKDESDGGL